MKRLCSFLALYRGLLRIGFVETIAYRAEMLIWILTTTFPFVMMALWYSAAEDGPIGGFGQADFVAYFLATLVVRQLASSWIVWELNRDIRTGELSLQLLRPLHPFWLYSAENLGMIPLRAVILLPLVGAVHLFFPEMRFALGLPSLLAFLLAIAGAWMLYFFVQATIGALAFWIDQSLAVQEAWSAVWLLLSGYLLPIALMPAWLEALARLLPFRFMTSFPVEIVTGRLSGGEIARGFLLQAFWVICFVALARVVWRRGIRRYGAFGA